jgi:MOSC domain-containing protein YiiM
VSAGALMRIVSLNVGLPREVAWHGRRVMTGIYKEPVEGRIAVRKLNLDGNRQADLSVHGGAAKAVYCYPHEHYEYWQDVLDRRDLPSGMFGENFTTSGLNEECVHLGDEFAIGTARFVVTQPRMPCYKLGIRFGSDSMVKAFLSSGRSGFYLEVTTEGDAAAGDPIVRVSRQPAAVRVADFARLYLSKRYGRGERAIAERALTVTALPESWKEYLRRRLQPVPPSGD